MRGEPAPEQAPPDPAEGDPGTPRPSPGSSPPAVRPASPSPGATSSRTAAPWLGGGATTQYVYPKHGGHRGEEEAPAVTPTSLERGITKDGDELVTFLEPPEKHTLVGVWVGGCGRRRGPKAQETAGGLRAVSFSFKERPPPAHLCS